ncbi:iron-sulfur cluster carrier protein ApbC [Thalassotalea euphylliae]|uniref:Iron-sulfur cluster carrier protein n=1 Tax=Thalassotalea euphylliae TaxID=1655234 RepID=A0A3E0UFF3_9GAMM|nr:iron-sulfur cluster carrier protein ApbC [Thalassotalea euphylliae]REL35297.1 iron-sulfur cluster carrier protein ApbC [Thalassotalea euphylliae]
MSRLSQFFSKKKPINPEDLSLIESVLDAYRSDAFPYGVLALSNELAGEQQKDKLLIAIELPFFAGDELTSIAHSLSDELGKSVEFTTSNHIEPVRKHDIAGVKNIIAIASGKGGVGKSTTTVNIARALQNEGARVGILDADIYGPSIPTMLGCQDDKPSSVDGKTMIPIDADGIYSMSIGYLVPDSDAAVWRGPMASTAFSQLLNETQWPELDYLLIDMPPGTGDIQLTLSQKVPVAGAVIVTTPQDIALTDAQKGIAMFDKVKVPVLGVVENMSYHICENCGHHSHLFGLDGGKDIAEINQVDLLGQLPLNIQVRQEADLGESLFNSESASDICDQYRKIARNIASKVFHLLDMRSPATPNIEILD